MYERRGLGRSRAGFRKAMPWDKLHSAATKSMCHSMDSPNAHQGILVGTSTSFQKRPGLEVRETGGGERNVLRSVGATKIVLIRVPSHPKPTLYSIASRTIVPRGSLRSSCRCRKLLKGPLICSSAKWWFHSNSVIFAIHCMRKGKKGS